MRKRLTLVVALCFLGGCTSSDSPESPSPTQSRSVATGYLLPRDRPAECELASGAFRKTAPPTRSYGAVLSPNDLDPNKIIDSIQVTVEAAEQDREVSADEEAINEERVVNGRRVRIAKAMETTAVDWWEDGWRVSVSAAERRERWAVETAAGITVPRSGARPEDTKLRVPDGLAMLAEITDRETSGSYSMSTRCRDRKPEFVTMGVSFIEGGADPRVLAMPGRNEKRSIEGRDYWVHTERAGITWTEGPAVAFVVTTTNGRELLDHARSLRRVSRGEVEEWIAEADAAERER